MPSAAACCETEIVTVRPVVVDVGGNPDVERARPILKWAGGKHRLLSQYAPYFPKSYRRYFEPFVGGAAVFFDQRVSHPQHEAFLSDVNSELINLYKQVKKKPGPVLSALERHRDRHCSEHYYAVRSQLTNELNPIERAARLIYLNRTCFNGLYRVNASGGFNVPMGRYKNPAILQSDRLMNAHQALQGVSLHVESYLKVGQRAEEGDFVYFDPPYWPLSPSSSFTSYTQGSFGEADQRSLANLFASLAARGVKVALSNSKTPLVQELYRDFPQITISAARCINSRPEARTAIEELLILSDRRL